MLEEYGQAILRWKVMDVVYVCILIVADTFFFEQISPFQRQFMINDPTIQHPFTVRERVPAMTLVALMVSVPPLIIVAVTFFTVPKRFRIQVVYISILSLFLSMSTCVMVTDIFKNWIGRLRPDFLARCQPKQGLLNNVYYSAVDACTTDNWQRLLDGFRTTPSGHSSMVWSSFGFISLWTYSQLSIYSHAFTSSIALTPLLYCFYVAFSRVQDYRHHFVDVCLGSFLGATIAYWSYTRYFPYPWRHESHVPLMLLQDSPKKDFYSELEFNNGYLPPPAHDFQLPV